MCLFAYVLTGRAQHHNRLSNAQLGRGRLRGSHCSQGVLQLLTVRLSHDPRLRLSFLELLQLLAIVRRGGSSRQGAEYTCCSGC